MMEPSRDTGLVRSALEQLIISLPTDALETSWQQIANLRLRREEAPAALMEYESLAKGHIDYLMGRVDPLVVAGLEHLRVPGSRSPAEINKTVLSPITDQPHARIVVVRCMDNRNTASNVELNIRPRDVCEITSAGHILNRKDVDSIAVGVGLKGAKVVFVAMHSGICGAIKLTLDEMQQKGPRHAFTRAVAQGIAPNLGSDTAENFAGALWNLNRQLATIFDPSQNIPLLLSTTGRSSLRELADAGDCIIVGVSVDYEKHTLPDGRSELSKRLTFLDSRETFNRFLAAKMELYLAAHGR